MKVRGGIAAALVALVSLAACDDAAPVRPQAESQSSAMPGSPAPIATQTFPPKPMEPGRQKAPPPVIVRDADEAVALHAWSYCFGTGCVDGAPRKNLPNLGSPEEVVVEFPLPEWSFTAYLSPSGVKCGRVQRVPLEEQDDGTWLLRPAGYAGRYDVTLMGRGDSSLAVTFEWTTPHDGPLPEPKGRLAVVADNDPGVISYGVELSLINLARTPKRAEATITVESATGESLTFEALRSTMGCDEEGSVFWDGPDDQGHAAAELGKGPFKYRVELRLGGKRYVGTATWPEDEIPGFGPYALLDFQPPLPALRSR